MKIRSWSHDEIVARLEACGDRPIITRLMSLIARQTVDNLFDIVELHDKLLAESNELRARVSELETELCEIKQYSWPI